MRISFRSPRSISAVKSRASKLRKIEPGLSQSQALERSAAFAGYANWRHATKMLPDVMRPLRLSAHWINGRSKQAGVETIIYPLPWSAAELVGTIKNSDRVSCFEDGALISDSTLGHPDKNQVLIGRFPSQALARKVLVRKLRELMFRETTSLRQRSNMFFDTNSSTWSENNTLDIWDFPGCDYFTTWMDPTQNGLLILAEFRETGTAFRDPRTLQEEWCDKHGFLCTSVDWTGTLQTGRSPVLVTSAHSGLDLELIKSKVDLLPDDFAVIPWVGVSEELDFPGWSAPEAL